VDALLGPEQIGIGWTLIAPFEADQRLCTKSNPESLLEADIHLAGEKVSPSEFARPQFYEHIQLFPPDVAEGYMNHIRSSCGSLGAVDLPALGLGDHDIEIVFTGDTELGTKDTRIALLRRGNLLLKITYQGGAGHPPFQEVFERAYDAFISLADDFDERDPAPTVEPAAPRT
jgi:hypothetical protein